MASRLYLPLQWQQCPPLRAETKLAAASGEQLLGQFN